jgi:HNH endonuclease/NUMOD4 motif
MAEAKEKWKPVCGYERLYRVSNEGVVVSNASGNSLRGWISTGGYRKVKLCDCGVKRHMLVHRIVASAFLTPDPSRPFVNHIDGDKLNNALRNLEYVTAQENSAHAVRIGRYHHTGVQANAKLTVEEVREIRNLTPYLSSRDTAKLFGISATSVLDIRRGALWRWVS